MNKHEQYVMCEDSKKEIVVAWFEKEQAEAKLTSAIIDKVTMKKQYLVFSKPVKASRNEVMLNEFVNSIKQIVVDIDRRIMENV